MSRVDRREALLARFSDGSLTRVGEVIAKLEGVDSLSGELVSELRVPLHTLKGEARMLGLASLAALVHALEDQLAQNGSTDARTGLARVRAAVALIHQRLRAPLVEDNEAARALEHGLALLSGDDPASNAAEPPRSRSAAPAAFSQVRVDLVEELCERLEALRMRLHTSTEVGPNGLAPPKARALPGKASGAVDSELRHELAELTELAWTLRLVPIEPALESLSEHAGELGRQLGKPLRVLIDAGGAQLERSLLERLQEPIMHLIRNALDHGIEPRSARGDKPSEATLEIIARSAGTEVEIAVVDDGRGVDIERVRQRARERGLLDEAEARAAGPRELLTLLFRAGFSTNATVNELSGRGVGLDAVRRAIEALGGEVTLSSTAGRGTRCELRVPATISRETVLVIQLGPTLWGLPSRRVDRVVALNDRASVSPTSSILVVDEHLPLGTLARSLGVSDAPDLADNRVAICCSHAERRYALASPPVLGEFELFRRPMGSLLASMGPASASAVMDDGRVVLLVDPAALLDRPFRSNGRERPSQRPRPRPRVLVVDDSPIVRELMVELLTAANLEVCTASDGQAALEVLDRRKLDLVLSDVEMPNMDGFELLRRVRKRDPELPIVMVTTRGSAADRERATSLGADAYLVKSDFHEKNMLEVIARFVEVKR